MKTKILKIAFLSTIILGGLFVSSFSVSRKTSVPFQKANESEYKKVRDFAEENICNPIRTNFKKYSEVGLDNFSRCGSGYYSEFPDIKLVKTDAYVNGKIVFYEGCRPKYVCDFKVCVAKGFAVVRSKGSKEYMSVDEWVKLENQKIKTIAKK